MLEMNYSEQDIIQFVLESGILGWGYSLEQQQNWVLLLAL